MFNIVYRNMTYSLAAGFIFVLRKLSSKMLENYKIITVTHKRINLKDIGRFVVKPDQDLTLQQQLENIKSEFGFAELMYVATCNRVMYFFTTEQQLDPTFTARFFQHVNPDLSAEWLDKVDEVTFTYEGADALKHLFDVAASIDSLVIGERQILGQLREAYEQCKDWKLTGDNIRLAMDRAVVAAKSVYSNTQIGDKPVSVVSLATQKLLNANVKKDARILVVGAGQTNQLMAKFLAKHQYDNVSVFNRTVSKAAQVAELVEGNAYSLEDLYQYKGGFDCLVVCTAVKEPIITKGLYQHLLQGDTNRKVVIDLAIPHNVDAAVLEEYSVQYIEIEGLRSLAQDNLMARENEVVNAQAILENYLEEFPVLYKQRQLELAMRRVPTEIKAVKIKAMNEVFRKEVDVLDDQTQELIERMMAYMEKKCIGIPMKAARETFL